MAIEKKWLAVPPRLMTADGTTLGVITTTSTRNLRVKMAVVLQAPAIPPTRLQVKKVLSQTQFIVGPFPDTNTQGKAGLKTVSDVSVYTVAAGSFWLTEEQDKSIPKSDDIDQAVYEQEPVVAKRTISVDEFGNFYNEDNPIPSVNVGSGADKPWDDLLITRDPVTQDITKTEYKKSGATVRTLDFTYDAYENLIEVKKS